MLLQLVDYNYYTKSFKGTSISSPDTFKRLSIEASSKVNLFTYNRINENNLDDNIRNTVCEIIDFIDEQNKLKARVMSDEPAIASETVGPHSKSYVNKDGILEKKVLTTDEIKNECYKICYENLILTGLMDRCLNT